MGAIASLGIRVVNRSVVDALGIKNEEIERVALGTNRPNWNVANENTAADVRRWSPLPNRNSRRRRSRDRFFDAQRCRRTSKAGFRHKA